MVAVVIIVKLGVAIPYFLLGFLFYIQVSYNTDRVSINMPKQQNASFQTFIFQVSSVAVASFSQPFRLNSYVVSPRPLLYSPLSLGSLPHMNNVTSDLLPDELSE